MAEQQTFAGLAWSGKKKVTRRERFLSEMDAVIPWRELTALVAPHYPTKGKGRPPMPLAVMLRLYFVQLWFNLSDPAAEDALYDSESIRRFVGVELGEDTMPDESTILRFRHLLEQHHLTAQMFEAVKQLLERKDLLVKQGTIVDATILHAPSSTKNASGERDPEMQQTKKGNQWYFGMKVHIGTDPTGLVHSITTTGAARADITQLADLLHGEEQVLSGDRAYGARWVDAVCAESGIRNRIVKKGVPRDSAYWTRVNRSRARYRAVVEHPFHVVKRLWGYQKVRYRGLTKNTVRLFAMFALANLYRVRDRLCPVS